MSKLIGNSLFIWAAIIPLAFVNGAFRALILLLLIGNAGYAVSGILLCALIFAVVSVFLPRLGPASSKSYSLMGLVWAVCTVLFETLLGLITGSSIGDILNNYNILTGNLWLFVVLFIGFAPWLVAKRKGII